MAQVTIATGYDVDYYLDQVGVDYYLTAAGEPPASGRARRRGASACAGRSTREASGDDAGAVPLRRRPGRRRRWAAGSARPAVPGPGGRTRG